MKYRVHRFELKMATDQSKLEQFLNSLKGEVVAMVPNVTISFFWVHKVDFLLMSRSWTERPQRGVQSCQ